MSKKDKKKAKLSRRSLIFSSLVFIVILFCLGSMCYSPKPVRHFRYNSDDVTAVVTRKEIDAYIKKNDTTNPEGSYIVCLEDVEGHTRFITAKLKEGAYCPPVLEVYGYKNGYTMDKAYSVMTYSGSGYIVITLDDDENRALGFPDYLAGNIDEVEFHSGDHSFDISYLPFKTGYFVFFIFLSAGLAIFAYYLESKYEYMLRAGRWIKSSGKLIRKGLLVLVCIAAISAIVEIGIAYVLKIGNVFHINRFLTIAGIATAFAWIYAARNLLEKKAEVLFFFLSIIIGVTFIVVLPFGHVGWDIDTHYSQAVYASYLKDGGFTHTDLMFTNARGQTLVSHLYGENLGRIFYLTGESGDIIERSSVFQLSPAHIPSGIALAVGRAMRLPFFIVFYMAEFANVLMYSLLGFFAIRKLKSGKLILMSVMMIPTNLFMASCFNYDYWVLGFSFLGMAYFIGECQRPDEKITAKSALIMCFAFMLSCLPKQIYAPMMLIPFLLPFRKQKKKLAYYLICVLPFIVMIGSMILRTRKEMTGVGDTRMAGGDVVPMSQMDYILSNPVGFIYMLGMFLMDYLSLGNLMSAFTNYAHMTIYGANFYGASIILVLIIAMAIVDKDECDRHIGRLPRIYSVLLYIGMGALIATAFYIVCTPVGSDIIIGTQSRYMTPMIYPLVSIATSGKLLARKRIYNKKLVGEILCFAVTAVIAMNLVLINIGYLK